jgi:hypothetical protein
MTGNTLSPLASDLKLIAAAFFVRNAIVLTGLLLWGITVFIPD